MEDRAWYVVQTYSGLESAAKRNLERRVESMKMSDRVFNIFVPEVIETEKKKNGETKDVTVKLYPGYVFIDMIVTDETWFMVRNTPMVTGFLGSSGGGAKPVPVQDEEINRILKLCGISMTKTFPGKVGGKAKVNSGNFAGQIGTIDSIDDQRQIVRILIDFFGRQTTIELDFNEVKVIE